MTDSAVVAVEDADVKRDMDLVRKIMLRIQDKTDLNHEIITIPGVDDVTLGRHMEMLLEAGLIDAIESKAMGRPAPMVMVRDLSWEGHEFIGAVSKDEVWDDMKKQVGPVGLASFSLKAIKDVAIASATAYLKGKMGL